MKIRPMLIMLQSVFLILSGGCLTNSSAAAPAPTVLRDFPPDLLLLPQESDVTEKAENAGIDYGNADQGYIMAWYSGPKNAKI
ncbi:MAG: hypothetical protein LBB49_04895, partial [Gracilibacteraceae bacterium]|nr:hypothetical protein [Gracilibacteraceae bacterium]